MSPNPCENWEAFHDQALDAADHAEFADHLPMCSACKARLQRLEQLEADVMAAWCLFSDEATGAANVQKVDLPSSPNQTPVSRRRWAVDVGLGAALAGIGLVVVWGIQIGSNPLPQQSALETQPSPAEAPIVESRSEQLGTVGTLPDVRIAFKEGTDGLKVLTRPSFSYVHVFPTVRRVPLPQN